LSLSRQFHGHGNTLPLPAFARWQSLLVREGINREEAMLQGFFGFVLGGVIVAVLFAYQPQLAGDVRTELRDLRVASDRVSDTRSERRYDDRRGYRDSAPGDYRDGRDRYDTGREPGNDQPPGGSNGDPHAP